MTTISRHFFKFTGCALLFLRESKKDCWEKIAPKLFPVSYARRDEVSCLKSFKCRTFRKQTAAKIHVDSSSKLEVK